MASQLPHSASGIEFRDFAVSFGKDKVVALAKHSDEHYTLHAGHGSGVLDLHSTRREADGTEHYQTLFAIQHSDVPAFLAELSSLTAGMVQTFRPLRVGWLHRNNIGVVHGLDPMTDAETAAITRKRKRRAVIDEEKLLANLTIPEYLDEDWDFPDGAFSLFKRGCEIGVGIKATDPTGHVHLHWFKLRDFSRLFSRFEAHFVAAALKYAIPEEKYQDYSVLEP